VDDKESDAEAVKTARAILRYLSRHPQAKDTLDGIATWWLLREWTERKAAEVKRAVSLLVEKKLVVELPVGGQSPCYKLNPENQTEVASFLSE